MKFHFLSLFALGFLSINFTKATEETSAPSHPKEADINDFSELFQLPHEITSDAPFGQDEQRNPHGHQAKPIIDEEIC